MYCYRFAVNKVVHKKQDRREDNDDNVEKQQNLQYVKYCQKMHPKLLLFIASFLYYCHCSSSSIFFRCYNFLVNMLLLTATATLYHITDNHRVVNVGGECDYSLQQPLYRRSEPYSVNLLISFRDGSAQACNVVDAPTR